MTSNHQPDGPLFAYRVQRRAGELVADPTQELAAEKLQSLHNALVGYRPERGLAGWKARLGLARRRRDPPQGLYLFGGVGRGKSMLMNLFFELAPIEAKRRVHFHAFMIETHERLHLWRQESQGREDDPLPRIAEEIAGKAWLLCFDELHVVNIADAMILARLFEALFKLGVVVVATSNWPPDQLYEGGLQREHFLPFIALVKERLDIMALDGPTDHRLARLKTMSIYHTPLSRRTSNLLEDAFVELTAGARPIAETLTVKGREMVIPQAVAGVARFAFAELCEVALGAEDYLAIARRFHAVIIDGVPKLSPERRDVARRFMTLIDALYEHRVKLVVGAEALPDKLYTEGQVAHEFQRTASRLAEMQSASYLAAPHLG